MLFRSINVQDIYNYSNKLNENIKDEIIFMYYYIILKICNEKINNCLSSNESCEKYMDKLFDLITK